MCQRKRTTLLPDTAVEATNQTCSNHRAKNIACTVPPQRTTYLPAAGFAVATALFLLLLLRRSTTFASLASSVQRPVVQKKSTFPPALAGWSVAVQSASRSAIMKRGGILNFSFQRVQENVPGDQTMTPLMYTAHHALAASATDNQTVRFNYCSSWSVLTWAGRGYNQGFYGYVDACYSMFTRRGGATEIIHCGAHGPVRPHGATRQFITRKNFPSKDPG